MKSWACTKLGTSDPYDWTDEVAESAREAILEDKSASTLMEVAQNAWDEGDRAAAMIFTRLAKRFENGPDVDALFAQILAG